MNQSEIYKTNVKWKSINCQASLPNLNLFAMNKKY